MSRSKQRRCAARGCNAYVNRSLLMCQEHWSKVPHYIKIAVRSAFDARGNNPDAIMTQEHADAIVAAVKAVADIEAASRKPLEATGETIVIDGQAHYIIDPSKIDPAADADETIVISFDYDQVERKEFKPQVIAGKIEAGRMTPIDPKLVEQPPADDQVGDVCPECDGRSGTISGEMQGDPDSGRTGYVEFFESCHQCVDNKLCPGCMRPAPTIDADSIEAFACELCGWHYDGERFYPDEPEYDPGDDFDAFDSYDEPFEGFIR